MAGITFAMESVGVSNYDSSEITIDFSSPLPNCKQFLAAQDTKELESRNRNDPNINPSALWTPCHRWKVRISVSASWGF